MRQHMTRTNRRGEHCPPIDTHQGAMPMTTPVATPSPAAAESLTMGHITVRGTELYYEQKGDGPPILLIPPSGATASTWGALADELTNVGRVIAYDRRGYSRSGGEVVRAAVVHTADAAAVLDALGAASAVVVGTSAGADDRAGPGGP